MEQPLNARSARRQGIEVVFARLLQEIGRAGVAGVALCVAAALAALGASERRPAAAQAVIAAEDAARLPAPRAAAGLPLHAALDRVRLRVRLGRRDEISLLLARIERAATGNGLPWSAADYRIVPATDRQAGALEVRCSFKAPYPALRAMLAELIATLPAMTFREMSFSRPDVGSAEVDAKFVIAVFLDDAPASSTTGAR